MSTVRNVETDVSLPEEATETRKKPVPSFDVPAWPGTTTVRELASMSAGVCEVRSIMVSVNANIESQLVSFEPEHGEWLTRRRDAKVAASRFGKERLSKADSRDVEALHRCRSSVFCHHHRTRLRPC